MSESGDDQFGSLDEEFEPNVEDGWQMVSQTAYDPEGSEDLTATIVFAIADVAGVDPVDLKSPVLYDCIDVAAVENGLFGPEGERGANRAQFGFDEYLVSVRSDGWVLVYERS